jgi:hypothetical protein
MNSALEALHGVKVLPSELRMPFHDDPLFHQNDSSLIEEPSESSSKLDVVLVSMNSARIALDPDDHSAWTDYALKTNAPNRNFGVLLTVEFKRNKPTMTGPPPEYKHKAMESIEPRSLDFPGHSAIQSGLYATESSMVPIIIAPIGPQTIGR